MNTKEIEDIRESAMSEAMNPWADEHTKRLARLLSKLASELIKHNK